jgi:hypothetical protein
MTSEGLGEMFVGDFADTCSEKFRLVLMGGRVEGLACADPGARTSIGASGNFPLSCGKKKCMNDYFIFSEIVTQPGSTFVH